MQCSDKRRKLDIEIRKEEIKSVVREKNEFESRDEPILYTILAFLDYQGTNGKTELIVLGFKPVVKKEFFLLPPWWKKSSQWLWRNTSLHEETYQT